MELVIPPKIEPRQMASTALYSGKAVLNGRMSDAVDLVKSNFWTGNEAPRRSAAGRRAI